MANVQVPDNPEYSELLRIIETKDLVHADIINPPLKTLLLNTAYLYRRYQELLESINKMATDNTYGGEDLSAEATVEDGAAQFTVLQKTSSTAQDTNLFSKPITGLRKGLYSLLIRLKASAVTDGNGLVKIQVSEGGSVIETRTITAKMFESANKYQIFGMNVDLSDSATITATLLKNSANITVSIDYIMLQPAQTAITSL